MTVGQRMSRLIDGLLELSHVTRAEIRYEMVDLSGLVESIAEELKLSDPERRVQFLLEKGLVAEGDRRLLKVALKNLLSNAWKFTEERARIEFGAAKQKGEPAFFVRDDGVGFDMAYADKLFGVFQRLHSPDEFEGTGIGLAMAARIVQRHGGRMWAEGELGRGATIYFTL
jgi:light-regulated signal transduction histidine kinase (bacteriophytochrome)